MQRRGNSYSDAKGFISALPGSIGRRRVLTGNGSSLDGFYSMILACNLDPNISLTYGSAVLSTIL